MTDDWLLKAVIITIAGFMFVGLWTQERDHPSEARIGLLGILGASAAIAVGMVAVLWAVSYAVAYITAGSRWLVTVVAQWL